jgi:hypothetical protein
MKAGKAGGIDDLLEDRIVGQIGPLRNISRGGESDDEGPGQQQR